MDNSRKVLHFLDTALFSEHHRVSSRVVLPSSSSLAADEVGHLWSKFSPNDEGIVRTELRLINGTRLKATSKACRCVFFFGRDPYGTNCRLRNTVRSQLIASLMNSFLTENAVGRVRNPTRKKIILLSWRKSFDSNADESRGGRERPPHKTSRTDMAGSQWNSTRRRLLTSSMIVPQVRYRVLPSPRTVKPGKHFMGLPST